MNTVYLLMLSNTEMGKFRSKLKGKTKGKRWQKGQSSNSNPKIQKYREMAKSRFFQENLGSTGLTQQAVSKHEAMMTYGHKTNKTKSDAENELTIVKELENMSVKTGDEGSESEYSGTLRSGTFKTFQTFASDWSQCSNISFHKLLNRFDSNNTLHKEMLAVLAAVTEVIKEQGGKETTTEYFAALMMTKVKTQGLVTDLMPCIRLLQAAGHFLFNYHADTSGMNMLLRKIYSSAHAVLIVVHYICMGINMAQYKDEVNELTANTITVLFFAHSIIKLAFFAFNSKSFYRTLAVWNQSNSHPLFTESDARYHQISLSKMRRLLYFICGMTVFSVISWVTLTFFGESVRMIASKETNETLTEPAPRLPLKAWYPFKTMSGGGYVFAFIYQIYFLLFSMALANLLDVIFCSWLIFACEQLQHLKAIMKPLMELSAALDTYRPNTAELFRVSSTDKTEKVPDAVDMDIRGIYSTQQDFGMTLRGAGGKLQNFNAENNPNGLTPKQEMLARSAIKYWVERHKHVVSRVTLDRVVVIVM